MRCFLNLLVPVMLLAVNVAGVAAQAQMLESIIEDEPIHSVAREDAAARVAICADSKLRAARETVTEERSFVAARPAGDVGLAFAAVAARQYADSPAVGRGAKREPKHGWSLTRPSGREISDADDNFIQFLS